MASRLPVHTARALDRLAVRAHAFHRFAHHPLCEPYAGELIRLGRRTRVCKGCALAGLGALCGGASAAIAAPGLLVVAASAGVALLLATGSLFLRLPKLAGRGLAATAGSIACIGGLLLPGLAGHLTAFALLAAAALIFFGYRRKGPNRAPCEACPERAMLGRCSGFKPIIQRERAFQRVAQRRIDALFPSPP